MGQLPPPHTHIGQPCFNDIFACFYERQQQGKDTETFVAVKGTSIEDKVEENISQKFDSTNP